MNDPSTNFERPIKLSVLELQRPIGLQSHIGLRHFELR